MIVPPGSGSPLLITPHSTTTFSSPRRRPLFASRKISSTFVRSGVSTKTAFKPTSSSAFLPSRIQSHDVVLPTTTHGQIRLRCVTQPDAAQAALLDRLGLDLPKRIRLAEHELPALAVTA
jgi:hypothetical protein